MPRGDRGHQGGRPQHPTSHSWKKSGLRGRALTGSVLVGEYGKILGPAAHVQDKAPRMNLCSEKRIYFQMRGLSFFWPNPMHQAGVFFFRVHAFHDQQEHCRIEQLNKDQAKIKRSFAFRNVLRRVWAGASSILQEIGRLLD